MVQAETGSITFRGVSGRSYTISFYASDVLAASCTFSLTGIATAASQTFFILPENVTLVDISIITGLTATTALVPYINDIPIGSVIPWANCVNTLAYRIVPQIPMAAGRKFTLIQA